MVVVLKPIIYTFMVLKYMKFIRKTTFVQNFNGLGTIEKYIVTILFSYGIVQDSSIT